jgi:hypothetical protein
MVTPFIERASTSLRRAAVTKFVPCVPSVPARVAGGKRKFTDDEDVWCNLINLKNKAQEPSCVNTFLMVYFTYSQGPM